MIANRIIWAAAGGVTLGLACALLSDGLPLLRLVAACIALPVGVYACIAATRN